MRSHLLLSLCLFWSASLFSQLRLPSVISSGMVLQRNDSVNFWGWGYNGQQVQVTGSWDNRPASGVVNNKGKWSFKLKTPGAGGPYTVAISSGSTKITLNDVMIGEVWLCSGQSNMEWSFYNGARFTRDEIANAYNKEIRFFHVPRSAADYPQEDVPAHWSVCDSNTVKSFSAIAYYFGKKLQKELNVPIGLVNASWGGTPAETWTPANKIFQSDILKTSAATLKEVPWGPVAPGLLYNGMIAPITRFGIAGVIWYQGEANVENSSSYSLLLRTMIDSWRSQWKKEFPFYFVQIAPYTYGGKFSGALLQEQQTKTMQHPNTGMVVITDLIDSVTNIHPSNKQDVGIRLANWALGATYHKATGIYKSPALAKLEVAGDKLILNIENAANGLFVKGKPITGFYISGENEAWMPAEGKIEGNKIILWNKNLKHPVHARFGFGNTIIGNVFNKEGLPLTPFRTDSWPVE